MLTPKEDRAKSFDSSNWTGSKDVLPADNAYWRQYTTLVDLYKYYLDIAWKVSVWYYAVTGVILTYFFDHLDSDASPYLPYLLVGDRPDEWEDDADG